MWPLHWLLCVLSTQVPSGQSINISLWDFGLKAARNRTLTGGALNGLLGNEANMAPGSKNNKICRVYATIKEKSLGRSVTVCGGRARHKHVYTSDTNEVEIRILSGQSPPNQAVYFLLEYQGMLLQFSWKRSLYIVYVFQTS